MPAELRGNVRRWLSQNFRIDEWGLNPPAAIRNADRPPSIGRERPLTEISELKAISKDIRSPLASLAIGMGIHIVYRMPREFSYEQLLAVRQEAEARLANLLMDARVQPGCIDRRIERLRLEGKVLWNEEEGGDWLLVVEVVFVAWIETGRVAVGSGFLGRGG